MSAPTDETLLKEFGSGERASFELLVRRHTPELYRFAYRITGNSYAAEDVVQETFLQVFLHGGSFDPKRRFKPWLFTIAGNRARDILRKQERHREVPMDAEMNEEGESAKRFVELFESVDPEPDEVLGLDEKRRIVRDVMAEMPVLLKEAIVLAYYHHFSYREIAEIIGIKVGTVKSRLHWAIVAFGERYAAAVAEQRKKRNA